MSGWYINQYQLIVYTEYLRRADWFIFVVWKRFPAVEVYSVFVSIRCIHTHVS